MDIAASRASRFAFVLLTAAALATGSLAGCAGGTPFPTAAAVVKNCIVAIAPASTETIGVNLTNPPQAACTDPTYMAVKGYFGGSTITSSQVISLTASSSNTVQWANVDFQPHTAANLGTWAGAYPTTQPNAAATSSPQGMDISTPGFTTGNINNGSSSFTYKADVPGVYIFGCAYHYISDNMRTVIIVK